MRTYLKNIYQGRYILATMVRQDFLMRYRRSVMGVLWSLLSPLGIVLIVGSVQSILWSMPLSEMIPYLFAGLTPWTFLSVSADGGTQSFLNAEGYIKQLNTPLEIFPLRIMLGAFVNMLFAIFAYFLAILFLAPHLYSLQTLMLIPALAVWLVMAAGLSTITAVLHTYARDYQPMQSLIIQALFYVTPIIYPDSILADRGVAWIYLCNPIYYLLAIIRGPLQGQPVAWQVWAIAAGIAVLLLCVAMLMFRRVRGRIVFKL